MKCYETRNECPDVERLIWDKVDKSWGEFGGVSKLSREDLILLKHYVDKRLSETENEI